VASQLVVQGLTRPVCVTHAPGDFGRLYIVEKDGRIRIFRNGALNAAPFLDIDALTNSTGLEFGLLFMCFHPQYATNGVFYINYIDNTNKSVVAQCRRSAGDPDLADAATLETILYPNQTITNHTGGWLGFGPDGYLYASFGDGGGQSDPSNRAQNTAILQGKMLRLDVDGADNIPYNGDDDGFPADPNRKYSIPPTNPWVGQAGFAPELWAYGFRNPWRCAFDRATGDLWIGDVGQNTREEIDFQPAGAGGRNYGWRCTEGTFCTGLSGCTCNGPTLTGPIFEYAHGGSPIGGVSVTGGHVYRGCAIPDLDGTYFFADAWSTGIFSLRQAGGMATEVSVRTPELDVNGAAGQYPVSFGEDAYGEMYWIDYGSASGGVGTGKVYKIVPAAFNGPDCNMNGRADACEIRDGSAPDANGNGVPDACDAPPCPADLDGDGVVGASDLATLLGSWGGVGPADLDGSGSVGAGDLAALLGSWGACS
jgi:glucose/arabinose dehydrogenase